MEIDTGVRYEYTYQVFGSVLRAVCRKSSDIDIKVNFKPQTISIVRDLNNLIKEKVDTDIPINVTFGYINRSGDIVNRTHSTFSKLIMSIINSKIYPNLK